MLQSASRLGLCISFGDRVAVFLIESFMGTTLQGQKLIKFAAKMLSLPLLKHTDLLIHGLVGWFGTSYLCQYHVMVKCCHLSYLIFSSFG